MAPTSRKSARPAEGKKGKSPQTQQPDQPEEAQASIAAADDTEIPELKRSQIPTGTAKYLDESLPPMDSLEDIFQDILDKAMRLGFADVLRRLGDRPLRVGTVCSGTESPLLALEMIRKGMFNQGFF